MDFSVIKGKTSINQVGFTLHQTRFVSMQGLHN